MKRRSGGIIVRAALTVPILVMSALGAPDSPRTPTTPAHAQTQTGTLLKTLNIPAEAQNCPGGNETAVTAIARRMAGVVDKQVLLGVSCLANNVPTDTTSLRKIHFLDPGSTVPSNNPVNATIAKSIVTPPGNVPTTFLGWGALTVRVDKGDLAACSNTSGNDHAVYKIDTSTFNTIPDGTAKKLFDLPNSPAACDGLAWDPGDNSFFQSFENATTITHTKVLTEPTFTSTALATTLGLPSISTPNIPAGFPGAGTQCQASGLAMAGPSIYVACGSSTTMLQITKEFPTAGVVASNTIATGHQLQDAECDPAWPNMDAIWSKDKVNNQLFAFQVPNFSCGFRTGDPTTAPAPAQCPTGSAGANPAADTDGDGLRDCWETHGIDYDGDGTADYQLPSAPGTPLGGPPDPLHKDLYLELDHMDALNSDQMAAINDVIAAFAAPDLLTITNPDGTTKPMNPDGTGGIRLHIQVDDLLTSATSTMLNLSFEPCTVPLSDAGSTVDFDVIKSTNFGTLDDRIAGPNRVNAKRFAFRYGIIGRQLLGQGSSGGCSEVFGNDLVITPWLWPSHGTRGMLNGTLMHEYGHALGRRHGGDDNVNCKPNYLSVMSYSRQVDGQPIANRKLDYSRKKLPTVIEGGPPGISEPSGIGGPSNDQTTYGVPKKPTGANAFLITANQPWNVNGDSDFKDVGVVAPAANPNNLGSSDCDGSGTTLEGSDDWSNLQYGFQDSFEFADGVAASPCTSDPSGFTTCGRDRLTDKNDFTKLDDQKISEVKKELTKEEADAIAANSAPFLLITMTHLPDPVRTARDLTYTVKVQNQGHKTGTNVTVTDTLPPSTSARFVSATPSSGTCAEASGVVTCKLGSLAVGSSATVTLVVRPRVEGPLTNAVGVSSDPDTQVIQSEVSETITVTKGGP